MKAESDTTIRLTLTSDEVQQAVLDWVRKNYRGSEAPHLAIEEVDFQFETEGEFEDQVTKTDAWPGVTTLLCRARPPDPRGQVKDHPRGR